MQFLSISSVLFAAVCMISIVAGYEIELTRFEIIPTSTNRNIIDPGTMRMKQVKRNTFVITGTLIAKRNFGSEDTLKLEYRNKIFSGQYVKLFESSFPLCDITKLDYYPKLREMSNLPPPGTCPMQKGNYTFNDLVMDESFLPKIIPRGENFVLSTIFVGEKPVYWAKTSFTVRYMH